MTQVRGFCQNADQEAGIVAYGVPARHVFMADRGAESLEHCLSGFRGRPGPFFGPVLHKVGPNRGRFGGARVASAPRGFDLFTSGLLQPLQLQNTNKYCIKPISIGACVAIETRGPNRKVSLQPHI